MRREWVKNMEFTVSRSFPRDYEYVHEKPCVCAVCSEPIKPKQVVRWVGNFIMHVSCIDDNVIRRFDPRGVNKAGWNKSTPLIEPGKEVVWKSHGRNSIKEKRGKVVAFIPAGTPVMDVAKELGIHIVPSKLSGSNCSDIDRYLVKILESNFKHDYDYYTPSARVLENS